MCVVYIYVCVCDQGRVVKQLKTTQVDAEMDGWMGGRDGGVKVSFFWIKWVNLLIHSSSGKRKTILRVKTSAILVGSLFCIKAYGVSKSWVRESHVCYVTGDKTRLWESLDFFLKLSKLWLHCIRYLQQLYFWAHKSVLSSAFEELEQWVEGLLVLLCWFAACGLLFTIHKCSPLLWSLFLITFSPWSDLGDIL